MDNSFSLESSTFDERVEILTRELDLAITWDRPYILLLVYKSAYVRAEAQSAIENYIIDRGQKFTYLHFRDVENLDALTFVKKFGNMENMIVILDGLKWTSNKENNAYKLLNHYKDIFNEQKVRIIFWLTQNEAVDLAHNAPEFWVHRHRLIEFVDSPQPEQMLHGALEAEWQGIGEYTDQFEDTDEKISLREEYLTELPRETEATSIRGDLLLSLAILNWRKGDYEKADELLKNALMVAAKIQDNWFEAKCFNAIALVKTSLGRNDEAVDAYKQAIHLAPGQIFAWNNLGNLCLKINRNDEAMITFQKAIEYNPRDPIAWTGLGNVYLKNAYMDDAIAAYRKSIEYAPTLSQPWIGLGDVYAITGRAVEAVGAYQKAVSLSSQTVTPWLRLGELFDKNRQNRDAIKAYRRALAIDPKNHLTWNALGLIYLRTGSFQDAADAFSKTIELNRACGVAYGNLALAYSAQGLNKEAIPLYMKSIELLDEDKDKAEAWNNLGNSYRWLNDYANAIAAYEKSDSINQTTHLRDGVSETIPESVHQTNQEKMESDSSGGVGDKNPPQDLDPKADSNQEASTTPMNGEISTSDEPAWLHGVTIGDYKTSSDDEIDLAAIDPIFESSKGDLMPTETTGPLRVDPAKLSQPAVYQDVFQNDVDDLEGMKPDITNAYAWNEKGNIHYQAGAFDDAIDSYNKAIQLDKNFGWPYANLALTYQTLGQYTEAILLYQKSIELLKSNQEKAAAWNGLGNVFRRMNNYENAVVAFQNGDNLDATASNERDEPHSFQVDAGPDSAQVWNDLGEIFFKAGSFNEAIQAFKKAIDLDPEFGWPQSNLALTFVLQGKYQEAISLYLSSIDLFKDSKEKAVSWNRLGNAYRKFNKYDNAIQAYQNAVNLDHEQMTLLTRTRFSLLSNCYTD